MDRWDIKHTKQLIDERYGSQRTAVVSPILSSLVHRLDYAAYHYQETKKAVAAYEQDVLSRLHPIAAYFSRDEEIQDKNFDLHLRVGANTIAAVQSIHAIRDILAHSIYLSLSLDHERPMREASIDADKVLPILDSYPNLSAIASHLRSLQNSTQFCHVAALSNICKHRQIVRPEVRYGLQPDLPPARLEFPSFKHKDVLFPAASLDGLIEAAYNVCSFAVIGSGTEVNAILTSGAALLKR